MYTYDAKTRFITKDGEPVARLVVGATNEAGALLAGAANGYQDDEVLLDKIASLAGDRNQVPPVGQ